MRKMTEKALGEVFAGESMAHMRYLMLQEIAEKAALPNIARLFKAISYAEQVHATNHARNLGILKDTADNLETCIQGETYAVEEMYPVFNATANLQGEKGAELSTHYALEAEKIHQSFTKKRRKELSSAKILTYRRCISARCADIPTWELLRISALYAGYRARSLKNFSKHKRRKEKVL
jgi:rubrerythrin